MFGRLPQMDIDFSMPREEVPRDTPAEYLLKMTERMRHTFNVVRQQLRHAMELRRERYNRGIRTRQYTIGQPVALKQTNKLVGNDKLHDRYAGPYYILSIWDNGVIRIKLTARTKPKLVHVDRVEPWTTTDPEIPEWVADAVKQFAPKKQEVGLQVNLDYEGGEIVGARPAPGSHSLSSLSLIPTRPISAKFFACQACREPEIDDFGVHRLYTRSGVCQICARMLESTHMKLK